VRRTSAAIRRSSSRWTKEWLRGAHAVETDAPVEFGSGADGVGSHVHQIAFAQSSQRVCITQMWVPCRTAVRWCAGRQAFQRGTEHVAAKAGERQLVDRRSAGNRDAISGTVLPKPCILHVTSAGILRIPASRVSNCTFRTRRSFSQMGGRSFSCTSTTRRAHCSASSGRHAISA